MQKEAEAASSGSERESLSRSPLQPPAPVQQSLEAQPQPQASAQRLQAASAPPAAAQQLVQWGMQAQALLDVAPPGATATQRGASGATLASAGSVDSVAWCASLLLSMRDEDGAAT